MKLKIDGIIFIIAGILFLVSAFLEKDYVSTAIGCCFIAIGISQSKKEK